MYTLTTHLLMRKPMCLTKPGKCAAQYALVTGMKVQCCLDTFTVRSGGGRREERREEDKRARMRSRERESDAGGRRGVRREEHTMKERSREREA